MEEETRYTKQDLETMRAWTLQRKIQVTQTRLIEWLGRYDWNVYVSFSGGKDSTVLADLAARVYQVFSCPKRQDPLRLVFVNTGLEYPEIQKFVRDFAEWLKAKYKIPVELEILHPSMTFPQVLSKYGYPVISKETAKVIYYARRGSRWAINRLDGLDKHGNESKFKERFKKYKFLIDAPFETSQLCCDVMKKGPAHRYEAETGRKPIVATMTEESEQRQSSWLKYGCNSFDCYAATTKSCWTKSTSGSGKDRTTKGGGTMTKYTTIAGDMWDGIAYKTLGDEAYTDRLMKLNPQYRRTFVFPAGITLTVPEPETRVSSDLPPWKRGTAE